MDDILRDCGLDPLFESFDEARDYELFLDEAAKNTRCYICMCNGLEAPLFECAGCCDVFCSDCLNEHLADSEYCRRFTED